MWYLYFYSYRLQDLQEQKNRKKSDGKESQDDVKEYVDAVAVEQRRLEQLQQVSTIILLLSLTCKHAIYVCLEL